MLLQFRQVYWNIAIIIAIGIASWTKLRRVVAWIILFKNELLKSIKRKPEDTDAGMKCNVNLLNEAENIILKFYQKLLS